MVSGRGGRREALTLTENDIVAKVIFSAKLMSSSKIYVSNRSPGSALQHREFSFHCPTPRVPNPTLQGALYQRIGGDLQELGSQLQILETLLCTIYMKKRFRSFTFETHEGSLHMDDVVQHCAARQDPGTRRLQCSADGSSRF